MRDDDRDPPLSEQFARFARTTERGGDGLYGRICRGVAGDAWLLELAATAPPAQRRPNLLLAAVHFLLLEGADHPLADFYPTVRQWRGEAGDASPPERGVFGPFRAFCVEHDQRLRSVLATRATQTNEIGRGSALLPAFAAVAASRGRPLGLVDLGASAGLNLLFDRYRYRYHPGGTAGAAGSPVTIECEVRRGVVGAPAPPEVGHRAALDERPLDAADPGDARWLLACQWPDEVGRFRRLKDALALAAADPARPRVRRGDLVDDLGSLVAGVPADVHLCLFHTWVAAYLAPGRQRALAAAVAEVARGRPLSWIFAENPFEVPGLPLPPGPEVAGIRGATALVVVHFDRGTPRARRMGDMHPHGRWLHWYGEQPPGCAPVH